MRWMTNAQLLELAEQQPGEPLPIVTLEPRRDGLVALAFTALAIGACVGVVLL